MAVGSYPQVESFLQSLRPLNVLEEKEKFFFDPRYNPQFEYPEPIDEERFRSYGPVEADYLPIATTILEKVTKKYKNNEKYSEETQGKLLSREEVEQRISTYLKNNGLETTIALDFSSNFLSRTSVYKNTLRIRLPINYREHSLEGTLNHEIGTHVFRRLNEVQQPWYKHHSKFGFSPYLETEEGIAVVVSQIPALDRHFWFPALNYYAAYRAQFVSFAELAAELKTYISDRDHLWNVCLKVKRGIKDTSVPDAFTKNQIYLRGAVKVLRWLHEPGNKIEDLYLGKIALEDVEKAESVSVIGDPQLPHFLKNKREFQKAVTEIVKLNKIEL